MVRGNMGRLELLLRARLGNFVPAGSRYLLNKGWSRKVANFVITPLTRDDNTSREEISEYMRRTFFKQAVVPSSLGLWKRDEGADAMFEKEMDLYLDSGLSFVVRSDETGELKGCFLNSYWPRDQNYDAIHGFDMNEWHKVSAKIAMDVCPERPEPLWRELQYQHMYNECQITLAKHGHHFCAYLGLGYVEPEVRGLKLPEKVYGDLGKVIYLYNGMWMAMPTVEALRNRKSQVKYGKEVGYVSYEDQVLATSEGRMVFRDHAEKGGMSLKVSDLSKLPLVLQYVIAVCQTLMTMSFARPLVRFVAQSITH